MDMITIAKGEQGQGVRLTLLELMKTYVIVNDNWEPSHLLLPWKLAELLYFESRVQEYAIYKSIGDVYRNGILGLKTECCKEGVAFYREDRGDRPPELKPDPDFEMNMRRSVACVKCGGVTECVCE